MGLSFSREEALNLEYLVPTTKLHLNYCRYLRSLLFRMKWIVPWNRIKALHRMLIKTFWPHSYLYSMKSTIRSTSRYFETSKVLWGICENCMNWKVPRYMHWDLSIDTLLMIRADCQVRGGLLFIHPWQQFWTFCILQIYWK